ncbi:MAG: hypothetical protein OXI33_01715 [Chloroflexota bacterium]|nr:hypothetical protein [Chloroflexota bacterium]
MDWAIAHGRIVFTHDLDFGTETPDKKIVPLD